jgi:homocysteine S-methyltransferase
VKAAPRPPFIEAVQRGVLVADGAMGTMLYSRGVFINRCFDELNLSAPSLVRDVHREYVAAGADVIETNTFGANRSKLYVHGVSAKLREINREGARLARSSAPENVFVAGAMGPLGVRLEPWGPTSLQEAREAFAEQARALGEGGVDLFLLETFTSLSELEQAVAGVRSESERPVVAQVTIDDEGLSPEGTPPEEFVPRIAALGVAVVGVNCGVGPQAMLEAVERASGASDTILSAMPNAGLPRHVEGRNIYLCSPDYMATYARRFIECGVRLIGGCCGTTPAHIHAIKGALGSGRATRRRRATPATAATSASMSRASASPEPTGAEKSRLGTALERGEFVVSVSLPPPRGWEAGAIMEAARSMVEAGVRWVDVPEEPHGSARLSPLALAALLQLRQGVESILHYACRKRQLPEMQTDLLGAHALGLRNIILRTGAPARREQPPEIRDPVDVDAIGLTHVLRRMNQGLDPGGNPLGTPTAFCIGVGANPAALDPDLEERRFRYKAEAGAAFAVTPPVFDVAALRRFLARVADCRLPIVAGVWPLASSRTAEFLSNEVPEASMAPEILERMRAAEERGRALEEGIEVARDILREIRPLVQGVQIRPPAGRIDAALAVLSGVAL